MTCERWVLLVGVMLAGCRLPEATSEVRHDPVEAGRCVGTESSPDWGVTAREERDQALRVVLRENLDRNGEVSDRFTATFGPDGQLTEEAGLIFSQEPPTAWRRTWTRDPQGRLVEYLMTFEGDPYFGTGTLEHHVHEWSEDGAIEWIVEDDRGDGVVDTVVTRWWDDGRVAREEYADGEGTLVGTITWTYAAPPPAMDHVEETDWGPDGEIDSLVERTYDADGRELTVRSESWHVSELRNTWSPEGYLLATEEHSIGPTGAEGRVSSEWRYNGRGLPVERVSVREDDLGVQINQTFWSWRCP